MPAASHAAARLLAAAVALVVLFVATPDRADAQPADLACPATVGGLPLSVTAAFSGTVRHIADAGGSLLCAYGEGVDPSAEVTVTWDSAVCGDLSTVVAPSLRARPFERAGAALVRDLGGPCPPDAASGLPAGALAAAGVAALTVVIVALVRRRHRSAPGAPSEPRADQGAARPVSHEVPTEPEPAPAIAAVEHTPDPSEPRADQGAARPVSHKVPTDVVRAPAEPALDVLSGPSGRAFARSGAGQWATVSAVAYASGNPVAGDLARAAVLRLLTSRRRPKQELAALADQLAHRSTGRDR